MKLNSQSYTNFLKMRQTINLVPQSTQEIQTQRDENDDPMDVDSGPQEKASRARAKAKDEGKEKGKGKKNVERKECRERQVESRTVPRNMQKLWQDGTHMELMLGEMWRSWETSERCR